MQYRTSLIRTKSRFATLCALVRASVSLHLHLRTSRILACLCMRNNAPVEHCVAERFYVIGNEVSYDIKKAAAGSSPTTALFLILLSGFKPLLPGAFSSAATLSAPHGTVRSCRSSCHKHR